MSDLTPSQIAQLYGPEYRQRRLDAVPSVRDALAWHRLEKGNMVQAACWYALYNRLPGDFLEFGVWEGLTIVEAYHAIARLGLRMRLHAFDSFEGLPAPRDGEDAAVRKGMFYTPREVFEDTLRRGGVDLARVTTTPGFFDASLTPGRAAELELRQAAVVWIDCDLYSSTVPVLDFVTPLLADGSVLIFDDWYAYHARADRGEQRACGEWLLRNPAIRLVPYRAYHACGQSFIVQVQ